MPLPTTNLLANWRADTGVTITGAGVSQWEDQSGAGRHLIQVTDGDRPSVRVKTGITSVYFDDEWMTIPATLSVDLQAHSVFIAFRKEGSVQGFWYHIGTTANTGLYLGSTHHVYSFTDGDNEETLITPGDGIELMNFILGPSNGIINHGSSDATLPANAVGTETGGYIGRWTTEGSLVADQLDVYEIAIYASNLNGTLQQEVSDYFVEAYGALVLDEPTYIVFEGDSLTAGLGLTDAFENRWTQQFARLCDSQPKMNNVASSGHSLEQVLAEVDDLYGVNDLISKNTDYTNEIAILWCGSNDLWEDRTEQQITDDIDAWLASVNLNGATTVICTLIARTDLSAPQEALRLVINTYILNTAVADYTVDLASRTELSDSTDLTYFQADGTHINTSGAAVVADEVFTVLEAAGYVSGPESGTSIPGRRSRYTSNNGYRNRYK
jgi:lysophospholipase L1-like esterase